MIITELVSSSRNRLWRRFNERFLYSAKFEDFIGIKCKPIADIIFQEYEKPYLDPSLFISFVALGENFLDHNFDFVVRSTCIPPEYFYIVSVIDSKLFINDKYIELKEGELIRIKRGSKIQSANCINIVSIIEAVPGISNLSRIHEVKNKEEEVVYITYDEMIKELENERLTNIHA